MKEQRFFGKNLRNNGAFYKASIARAMDVVLWETSPVDVRFKCWRARLVLADERHVFVETKARTPETALRLLERRSLSKVGRMVSVFAKLSNSAVLDVRKNIHKSRKK